MPTVTLIGKPGCHLCDDARVVISEVIAEVRHADPEPRDITLTELSILDDPDLAERFGEEIPVVLIDGRKHSYWRVDPVTFAAAIRTD